MNVLPFGARVFFLSACGQWNLYKYTVSQCQCNLCTPQPRSGALDVWTPPRPSQPPGTWPPPFAASTDAGVEPAAPRGRASGGRAAADTPKGAGRQPAQLLRAAGGGRGCRLAAELPAGTIGCAGVLVAWRGGAPAGQRRRPRSGGAGCVWGPWAGRRPAQGGAGGVGGGGVAAHPIAPLPSCMALA